MKRFSKLELSHVTDHHLDICGGSTQQLQMLFSSMFGILSASNYALKRTATDNQANFPDAARSVHNNFYMDDYLESSPTANEASYKAKDLLQMLALGGFKLTKFVSNVPSILIEVDPNSDQRTTVEKEKEIPIAEKFSLVLGLTWTQSTDTLNVSRGTSPKTDQNVTQRAVLSLVSAVYDPIGLVAPFTIKARLLSKDIWTLSGQQWDDNMPDDIVTKILDWTKELSTLNEITILRSYFCQTVETIQPPCLVIAHKMLSAQSLSCEEN